MSAKVELKIGGRVESDFDELTIDSDLFVPADAFGFVLAGQTLSLPDSVQPLELVECSIAGEPVLSGVLDRIAFGVDSGLSLALSGRDLMGQIIDTQVPVQHSVSLTLEALIRKYVTGGDLAWVNLRSQISTNHLKKVVAIEPGQSLYDPLNDLAEASDQWLTILPSGELWIGNPKDLPQPKSKPVIKLGVGGEQASDGEAISYSHEFDASNICSNLDYTGQTPSGSALSTELTDTRLGSKTRRHILAGSALNQAEANLMAKREFRNKWLSFEDLSCTMRGFTYAGSPWAVGWQVQVESSLPRAAGSWIITGRTFSRSSGDRTELRLKRLREFS